MKLYMKKEFEKALKKCEKSVPGLNVDKTTDRIKNGVLTRMKIKLKYNDLTIYMFLSNDNMYTLEINNELADRVIRTNKLPLDNTFAKQLDLIVEQIKAIDKIHRDGELS